MRGNPLFIVDDEADAASLNTLVNKNRQSSINKYLGNNKGSIIDFQLLKDAVDRHCDSVEDDINVQTPVPLYCGLAGTMLGVIIGLASLLFTNSIYSLMTGSTTGATASGAATGVSDLLSGVALAMIASVCGIGLTTCNSLLFKKYKLEQEKGKNTFLAWMQSKLLPELPSDTSPPLVVWYTLPPVLSSAVLAQSASLVALLMQLTIHIKRKLKSLRWFMIWMLRS